MSRSYSLPGWESRMGEVLTKGTKSMHHGMSRATKDGEAIQVDPPAFLGARASVQIREIVKGQGDLSGSEGMQTNSRRGNYGFIVSTGLDILLTTAADRTVVWSFPPLAKT